MPTASSESTSAGTSRLLQKARLGDSSALRRLFIRSMSGLGRWAHRQFPAWLRSACDTADLLHDAVLHTIQRLERIDIRGTRALSAYLRQAVRNRIRDEHRRMARRGVPEELSETLVDSAPSPLDRAVAGEVATRYRAAKAQLRSTDRFLIVAHVELGYTHDQLACVTGQSPNAVRVAVQRAMRRLAARMNDV